MLTILGTTFNRTSLESKRESWDRQQQQAVRF